MKPSITLRASWFQGSRGHDPASRWQFPGAATLRPRRLSIGCSTECRTAVPTPGPSTGTWRRPRCCHAGRTTGELLRGRCRLDNRAELNGVLGDSHSDAELLERGYDCWGTGLANRLLGDFAFALWDAKARGLYAARDCFGVRPLYYHAGPTWLVLASEMEPILTTGLLDVRLEERTVLDLLTRGLPVAERDVFCEHLPRPARALAICHATDLAARSVSGSRRRATAPGATATIRGSSAGCFALRWPTDCRGRGTAAAHLSGGLDSSSIVCMANQIFRGRQGPGLDFHTLSAVYPGQECDEVP